MGLQKYRADQAGDVYPNGSQPFYANWIGGPSLALVRNCPIELLIQVKDFPAEYQREKLAEPRTVYIRGEADTWTSQPAACRIRGKAVYGSISCTENGFTFTTWQSDEG